jgi:pilus assembly protein Flp/PilA
MFKVMGLRTTPEQWSWTSISGVCVMKNLVTCFVADESGATAIEYALLAVLIAVGVIGAASTLGKNIGNTMNNIAGKL